MTAPVKHRVPSVGCRSAGKRAALSLLFTAGIGVGWLAGAGSLVGCLLGAGSVVGGDFAGFGALTAHALELPRDEASGLHYLEVLTGGAVEADVLPMVFAIHGLGDNPEAFRLLLDDLSVKARLVFPRGPMPRGEDGFSWFAFRANDPEGTAELSEGLRAAAERVAQLVVSLSKRRGGPAKVVVCGFSQGGMLTFALAAAHPELVAAAFPVAGFLPPPLWPAERPKVRPLPKVLALHGDKDRLIPLDAARWSVEALRTNGYDVTLRSWPEVGHSMPPQMRALLRKSVEGAVAALTPAALEGPPLPPAQSAPSADEPTASAP